MLSSLPMNHPRHPLSDTAPPRLTQAADGMPRRAFTVKDVEAMVAAGIIPEDERFEMVGGEIVPMSAKGARHEWVKMELNRHFQKVAPTTLDIAPETTLRLDDYSFVEPDFCVFDRTGGPPEIDPTRVHLCVEVADSSLAYDLGRKIGIYAAYGIREVWVVNALTLVTRVHRRLGAVGYIDVVEIGPDGRLEPAFAPDLAVTLADLGLTPAGDDTGPP